MSIVNAVIRTNFTLCRFTVLILLSVAVFFVFHNIWNAPLPLDNAYPWTAATVRVSFVKPDDKSVVTYANVCIEPYHDQRLRTYSTLFGQVKYLERQRIVIYDSGVSSQSRRNATIGHTAGSLTMQFADQPMPDSHRLMDDAVAYFWVETFPGNFYHFWADQFEPLYSAVSRTGRLQPGARNYMFYAQPLHLAPNSSQDNYQYTRFNIFLDTLYFHPVREVFWLAKENSCFPNAVFQSQQRVVNRDAVEHVVRSFFGDAAYTAERRYVTIIQRTYRRLLNPEEMAQTARNAGFKNVRVVVMEELTLTEQVRVAVQSCILVGVQGAGLSWSAFMAPQNSTLVEIAWPDRYWHFAFSRMTSYSVIYHKLHVDNSSVRANWTSYQHLVLNGRVLDDSERQNLLRSSPSHHHLANIWKWADVYINSTAFAAVLKECRC